MIFNSDVPVYQRVNHHEIPENHHFPMVSHSKPMVSHSKPVLKNVNHAREEVGALVLHQDLFEIDVEMPFFGLYPLHIKKTKEPHHVEKVIQPSMDHV